MVLLLCAYAGAGLLALVLFRPAYTLAQPVLLLLFFVASQPPPLDDAAE